MSFVQTENYGGYPMTEATMRDITERYPELSDFGFGVYDPRSKTEHQRKAELAANREMLFDPQSLEQFDLIRGWLRQWAKTKDVNKRAGTF